MHSNHDDLLKTTKFALQNGDFIFVRHAETRSEYDHVMIYYKVDENSPYDIVQLALPGLVHSSLNVFVSKVGRENYRYTIIRFPEVAADITSQVGYFITSYEAQSDWDRSTVIAYHFYNYCAYHILPKVFQFNQNKTNFDEYEINRLSEIQHYFNDFKTTSRFFKCKQALHEQEAIAKNNINIQYCKYANRYQAPHMITEKKKMTCSQFALLCLVIPQIKKIFYR